jgi:hypothetical protein
MDREDLLRREDEAWAGFAAEVDRIEPERREGADVVPGWSVKDLVWHCAYWATFCGDAIAGLDGAAFRDPFGDHDDAYWDAENERVALEGRGLTWDQVRERADDARRRVRDAFEAGPDDDRVAAWFAEETFEHYDEHAEQVRSFATGG